MAHDLVVRNGKVSMMYANQAPWHGLGQRLDSPPDSTTAIHAAGLAWEIGKFPVFAKSNDALMQDS